MDAMLQSEELTLQRFNAKQDRVARDMGYGDTVGAQAIAGAYLQRLSTSLPAMLEEARKLPPHSERGQFCRLVEQLSPEVVALCALTAILDGVATKPEWIQITKQLGTAIAAEAWAQGLLVSDKALSTRINKAVRDKHGSLKYRKQAARSLAARAGYKGVQWSPKMKVLAGGELLTWVLETLPEVFSKVEDSDGNPCVALAPEALTIAEAAVEACLRRRPVFLPCTEAPKPWTGWHDGGYWDKRSRLRASVVRTYHKDAGAAVRGAIHNGQMKPHLDGINNLQAVAWRINRPMLELVKACAAAGMTVSGLPATEALEPPTIPRPWDQLTDDEKRLWRRQADRIEERNRGMIGDRLLFVKDMETAVMMAEAERFYTPMNCDWRGRVYGVSHFNFQRDDRVRALFEFADGEPLGEEGLYWLKVHVANCGDFEKISKQPFDARVAWVDVNMEKIAECADSPLRSTALSFWTTADTPFLFVAACLELMKAVRSPSLTNFTTHLPVSFDGSCSGLQHLCAMTRAPEGSLVNLTPSPQPQDVYQTVATAVARVVAREADGKDLPTQKVDKDGKPLGLSPDERVELAKLCMAYGISRSVVKRNVMTYAYSSKKFGMAKQLDKDLMGPLTDKVIAGELQEHPFGRYGSKPHPDATSQAALYLADKIYTAIQATVNLPERAMVYLRKCAQALAHEGKALRWTTPVGLPWLNIYRTPKTKTVELWLHNSRIRLQVADGTTATIEKDRAANGVAPNFVHALDAAHLILVVNAAAAEGIHQVATVHDSFGCLASRAGRFRNIIREQFVAMYEQHDVLAEVLEAAKHDLTFHNWQRLPQGFEYGSLNVSEVLNAPFAFA